MTTTRPDMRPAIKIKSLARKSLAMKVTPAGVEVLIPRHLAADSEPVQRFITEGLSKLAAPAPAPGAERLSKAGLLALVEDWAGRLEVQVGRVQVQPMSQKWGSISTAGNLSLAADLVTLPKRLVDYVICHELLHLKVPNHTKLYYLLLRQYIPDWREREQALAGWTLAKAGER